MYIGIWFTCTVQRALFINFFNKLHILSEKKTMFSKFLGLLRTCLTTQLFNHTVEGCGGDDDGDDIISTAPAFGVGAV